MRRKYWTIFRVELENTLAFRGPALIWTLFDLLWIAVFPFLWLFIVEARGGEVNGWNGSMIITYYVFLALLNNIVLMHPEAHMANQIYKGNLTNYIVTPQSFLGRMFLHEAAYKVVRLLMFAPVLVTLIVVLVRVNGVVREPAQMLAMVITTVLAIPIFFLVAFIVGMSSFWLEDAYVVRTIFWASHGLFGGQYAPFELMPKIFNTIASFLPFKYAIYFPLRVVSQTVPPHEIMQGIGIQLMWIALLFIVAYITWRRGLVRYSAVGR